MSNRSSTKKYGLGMILAVFSFVTIFGSIIFAQPAQAQFGINTLLDIPRMTGQLIGKIKEGLGIAVMTAAQKAVSYLLRKVAYDSAVWLASGGKGQSPFAHTSSFTSYMRNVAGDALGEAIGELGKPFGLNLCKTPDVKIDLAIKIGVRQNFDDSGPMKEYDCSWNSFKEQWSGDAWKSKYRDKNGLLQQFNASLKADTDSDLGIYLKTVQKVDRIVSQRTEEKKLERQEGQGFKGLTSLISGDVKTPSQVMKEEMKENTGSAQQKKSEGQISAALGSGTFQILPSTLSLFLNTLASQMIKNFKEKGMLPFGICIGEYGGEYCKSRDVTVFEGEGIKIGGRAAASAAFSEFLVANIKTQDNYDILAQLNNCPESPGVYNCRADEYLIQAIQEAKYGKPVTIAEALEKNWIHPDWKLLSKERPENSDINCYNSAYCYSNIKVLRQVRILPLGFEIAALRSDPDNPWTIKQVVDGFDKCNPNGSYDPVNFPFCHLIDPNWVLKIEPTRCNALVNSAQPLMSDAPDRLEDCVDLSNCVAYNKDGTCLSYSYCTREKNFWRFDADPCDSFYNTCKAFTDVNGNSVSYLYRTLDTSFCNQNTVGCSAYSLNKDSNGNWLPPSQNTAISSYNNGIHFNSKLSSSCGSNSFGCSAFNVVSSTDVLYLRKAPEYLGCYDANPQISGVQWPQNNADLSKIKPKPDCSLYASVCSKLEAGCNLFTSLLTGEEIPGKFIAAEKDANGQLIWNDQCDAKCDGYDAYREMPNNYSNGRNIAYIIPKSGNTCTAEEEGCSSFTNMEEIAAGGEKVEYYSYLRPCINPDANQQKNFYTYEGNKDGGYQLKSYTLQKDENGAPKYWYRTSDDLADYERKCNSTNYRAGLADPDCRQFNDENGNVYYALLSKTIVVSDRCTYYRLNSSELVTTSPNPICFQNGEYKDGFCYYHGLPSGVMTTAGASKSCSAKAVSCHAYKGNTGNNVKQIFADNFENQNQTPKTSNWSADSGQLLISTESTHFGEHSLLYTGNGTLSKDLGNLTLGRSYVLTFWAKGDVRGANISLFTDRDNIIGSFDTTDVWQYYKFSPVELNGTTTSVKLRFTRASSGQNLFIDNIQLVEITDYLYLVRDSLNVDPVCDSNLNDNLPGQALGCTGYKLANNPDSFYLTNFSYLCRKDAVGCTALQDTYNTLTDTGPQAFNVRLLGAGGTTPSITINGQTFKCTVVVGENSCYTDIAGFTRNEIVSVSSTAFVTSTVYVPADTTSSIYLVANKEASCNQVDVGCTYAGLQTIGVDGVPRFTTVTIKNDPATYKDTLCQSEAVGCNSYSFGEGSFYFKDPAVTGQKICEYKSGVMVDGVLSSGWFWKNVGVCSSTVGTNEKNCTKNEDCSAGDTCVQIGNVPCYKDYLQVGNNYGLWSFGDRGKYKNFVGECPINQSGCTEFVDRNDQKDNSNGRSYYFLNNSKISAGDCDGLVGLKDGCALFDQTDKPTKLWDTRATYLLSEKIGSRKVEPVTEGNKDANVIIKVVRDRECGEWLQCVSSHRVWDDKNSKWKEVCDQIGRCNKAPTTIQEDNITNCANYLDERTNEYFGKVLTQELYQTRDVSWAGMDFSGYSFLDMYQPDELVQFNIASSSNPDYRLVKFIPCGGGSNCKSSTASSTDYSCKDDVDGKPCGRNNIGICLNNVCVVNHRGNNDFSGINSQLGGEINKLQASCRAYPEKTSPFPFTSKISKSRSFSGVNLCNESAEAEDDPSSPVFNCECDYTKVTYGNGFITKYFGYKDPNTRGPANILNSTSSTVPSGICQGGDKDGYACSKDSGCANSGASTGGTCQKKKSENKILGWKGYCLEYDYSRNVFADPEKFACLSWLPVGSLSGYSDIDNQYVTAGYNNSNKAYCIKSSGLGLGEENDKYYVETRQKGGSNNNDNNIDAIIQRNFNNTLPLCANGEKPICIADNGTTVDDALCALSPICENGSVNYNQVSCPNGYTVSCSDKSVPFCEYGCYSRINSLEEIKNSYIDCDQQKNLVCREIQPNQFGSPLSIHTAGNGYDHEESQSARAFIPAEDSETRIHQDQIDYVTFTVIDGDWEDPRNGTKIFVYPNYYNSSNYHGNGAYAHFQTKTDNSNSPGIIAVGYYMGKENMPAFLYGDSQGYVDTQGNLKYDAPGKDNDGKYVSGNALQKNSLKINERLVDQNGLGIFDSRYDLDNICPDVQDSNGNWHVVVMQFNSSTKLFEGYRLFYCDDSPNRGGISYSVGFRLRETCEIVARTDFGFNSEDSAPWTDRLWKEGRYRYVIPYNTLNSPFGSTIWENFDKLIYLNEGKYMGYGPGCQGGSDCLYASCPEGDDYDCSGYNIITNEINEINNNNNNNNNTFIPGTSFGYPLSCGYGTCYYYNNNNYQEVTSGFNQDQAINKFTEIFARPLQVYSYDYSSSRYISYYNSQFNKTNSSTPDLAPKVRPVGPCNPQGQCKEIDKDGITINDRWDRNVIINTSPAKVIMKFYAFASKNQMPLRSIWVEWGDNSGGYKSGGISYFRNRRGAVDGTCLKNKRVCQLNINGVQVKYPERKCTQDLDCQFLPQCVSENQASEFGMIVDKTCDNDYYRFDHVYKCVRNGVGWKDDCPDTNMRAKYGGCCVFKPRVQVKDNWGWCNASSTSVCGGDGCYDGNSDTGLYDECLYMDFGSYTEFQRNILVAPR